MSEPVRVFIGSGEASLVERKVLIHSLRRGTRRPLDIQVFNGTHNAVEREGEPPRPAPLGLAAKYRNTTEFSNYRFLVPEVCGYQGRAIYLDSDIICLTDIGALFDQELGEHALLAKPDAHQKDGWWATSVMLIDCTRARFDLEGCLADIDAGRYAESDLHQLSPSLLRHRPLRVGPLDRRWNSFDRRERDTRLVHYTNLLTQPWRFAGHPEAGLWFEHLRAALTDGAVTERDLELSALRGHVRPDLLDVALGRQRLRRAARALRGWWRTSFRGE